MRAIGNPEKLTIPDVALDSRSGLRPAGNDSVNDPRAYVRSKRWQVTARRRALLVGDAAGMVSPVTAGGIHTALRHGRAAGVAIADFLAGHADDPAIWLPRSYPRFRMKRALRWAYDNFQSDTAFNLLLRSSAMRAAASIVFFHRMRAR